MRAKQSSEGAKAAEAARKQAERGATVAKLSEEENLERKAAEAARKQTARTKKRAEGQRQVWRYKTEQTELTEPERIQKKREQMGTRYEQERATRARDEALRRYRQRFPEKGKPPARAAWPPVAPQSGPDAPSDAERLDTYISLLDGGLCGCIHTCPNCKERGVSHGVPIVGEWKDGQVTSSLPLPCSGVHLC